VKNLPSDLGGTGLLKSWKNPACALDKSPHPVSAVQASPGCHRIAWVVGTTTASGSALEDPTSLPSPPFWWHLHSCFHRELSSKEIHQSWTLVLPQTFLHCIKELQWIKKTFP